MLLRSPKRLPFCALLFVSLAGLLSSCAPSGYYVRPKEWSIPGATDAAIEAFRPYLTGKKIFLDPGHGGEDRFNRGPASDAIEADVNLRVALDLRNYLQQAGATVILSRDRDASVALQDRPKMAVAAGADVFVSLHHNATGSRDEITNYSSVYYHSVEGRPDYHPANHDLARYIERDMAYAMRNPSPPYSPTFDGTLSDFDIYPNSGFAVLRGNPLPAVLIEGSFFSHPPEEQRLALREFNTIEAWGIFVGLGKYFRAGIPELKLLSDSIQLVPRPAIRILAAPRDDIDKKNFSASFDEFPAGITWDDSLGIITVVPSEELTSGVHRLRVQARNLRGNWSWPFSIHIKAMLPVMALSLTAIPSSLPRDQRAVARLECEAFDKDGHHVADGSIVRFTVAGTRVDTNVVTNDGFARLLLHAPVAFASATVSASANEPTSMVRIPLVIDSARTYVRGTLTSTQDSLPIAAASVAFVPPAFPGREIELARTAPDGSYFLFDGLPDTTILVARARGFFAEQTILDTRSRFLSNDGRMTPVAAGRLFGKTYLIDPRFGGSETGEISGGQRSSDLNLSICKRLASLLDAAGAEAVLVRETDTTMSEQDRAKFSGSFSQGIYIRIDASTNSGRASSEIYWNLPNQNRAALLLKWLHITAGLDSAGFVAGSTAFYRDVALATISVIVPSAASGFFFDQKETKTDAIAWGLFMGLLENEGFSVMRPQAFRVVDLRSANPIPGVEVVVDGTLSRYTDARGTVDFYGLARDAATFSVKTSTPSTLQPLTQKP